MQIVKQNTPHIREKLSKTHYMMLNVLIALAPVVVFAMIRFGTDSLFRMLVSLAIMIGLEALSVGLIKRKDDVEGTFFQRFKHRYKSYSITNIAAPAVSAIIFYLTLPSQVGYHVVIIGAVVGIVIGKLVFGGLGKNIFNPAAVGRLFVGYAFWQDFKITEGLIAGATPLELISNNIANAFQVLSFKDLIIGTNVPGAMGEISALLIVVGLAWLLISKAADFRVVLASLVTFVLLITIAAFVKVAPNEVLQYVSLHLLSGGLLFGVAFMITDPVTSPTTKQGRIIYGGIIGALIVILRLFSDAPEGVAMALLFGNLLVPLIDYLTRKTPKKYSIVFAASSIGAILLVGLGIWGGLSW